MARVSAARDRDGAGIWRNVAFHNSCALVQDYFPKDFERSSLEHAESGMERLVGDIVPGDVTYKLHIEHGSNRTHVLARGKDIDADPIAMASPPPPDQLREFLVGSHAD